MSLGIRFPDSISRWTIHLAARDETEANRNYSELNGSLVTETEKAHMDYVRRAVSGAQDSVSMTTLDALTQEVLDMAISVGCLVKKTVQGSPCKAEKEKLSLENLLNLKNKITGNKKLSQQLEIVEKAILLFKKQFEVSFKKEKAKENEMLRKSDVRITKLESEVLEDPLEEINKELSVFSKSIRDLIPFEIPEDLELKSREFKELAGKVKSLTSQVTNQYLNYARVLSPDSETSWDHEEYQDTKDAFLKKINKMRKEVCECRIDGRSCLIDRLGLVADAIVSFDEKTLPKFQELDDRYFLKSRNDREIEKLKEDKESVQRTCQSNVERIFAQFLESLEYDAVLDATSDGEGSDLDMFEMDTDVSDTSPLNWRHFGSSPLLQRSVSSGSLSSSTHTSTDALSLSRNTPTSFGRITPSLYPLSRNTPPLFSGEKETKKIDSRLPIAGGYMPQSILKNDLERESRFLAREKTGVLEDVVRSVRAKEQKLVAAQKTKVLADLPRSTDKGYSDDEGESGFFK